MSSMRPALIFGLLLICLMAVAAPARAQGSSYNADQLDQMVAPIALYPDNLLTQILMASAYPLEVVEADRWVQANSGLSDAARQNALAAQTWDPSVTSLTAFPAVLEFMSQNLSWTEAVGEAFLGQQADVMNAVQRMRARAEQSGALQSTAQLSVTNDAGYVEIAPASPDVCYVPYYNPVYVYGPGWARPSWYWPGIMVGVPGWRSGVYISFGAGLAVGYLMFGGYDWHHHNVYINNHYWGWSGYHGGANYHSVYRGPVANGRTPWQFNSAHRANVNFRNPTLQQRYNSPTAGNRNELRGYTAPTNNARPGVNAGNTLHPTVNTNTAHPTGNTINPGNTAHPTGNTINPGNTAHPPTNISPGNTAHPTGNTARPTINAGNVARPPTSPLPFNYSPGGVENRASNRGANSSGNPGGGFQHVTPTAPSRPVYTAPVRPSTPPSRPSAPPANKTHH